MITEAQILNYDWKWLKAERKSDGNYEEWEVTIQGRMVTRKTKKKRVLGTLINSEQEWFVCDGFIFMTKRQLCSYLNEQEVQSKQQREWKNQFKYRLDINL